LYLDARGMKGTRMKQNCWQVKHCGREPGGSKAGELGVCAAASATALNGTNGGCNGGRACWAIAGTLCGGKVQGTYATNVANCMQCEFYRQVAAEEGANHAGARVIMEKLAEAALARK
jgi:hypothetical protein